jgi:hypothetical protein
MVNLRLLKSGDDERCNASNDRFGDRRGVKEPSLPRAWVRHCWSWLSRQFRRDGSSSDGKRILDAPVRQRILFDGPASEIITGKKNKEFRQVSVELLTEERFDISEDTRAVKSYRTSFSNVLCTNRIE